MKIQKIVLRDFFNHLITLLLILAGCFFLFRSFLCSATEEIENLAWKPDAKANFLHLEGNTHADRLRSISSPSESVGDPSAKKNRNHPNNRNEIKDHNPKKHSTKEVIRWNQEMQHHNKEGKRCYKEAKDYCWYIPNLEDREIAKHFFVASVATLGCSIPSTKLVSAIIILYSEYGCDQIDGWNYVENKLHWAKYHFEMADFYENLLHPIQPGIHIIEK